jgi:hypothetical protein
MTIRKVGRDAVSGRFISLERTRRFPGSTVVETVEVPKRRRAVSRRRRAARHLTEEKQNR